MKLRLHLFFLTIMWVPCTLVPSHAAGSGDANPPQQRSEAAHRQQWHGQLPKKKPSHGPVTPMKPRHLQLRNTAGRSAAGGNPDVLPPNIDRSTQAVNRAQGKNESLINAPPAQLLPTAQPSATSPNNMRHRSPNPAMVGGPKSVTAASRGAINGSHMARKP